MNDKYGKGRQQKKAEIFWGELAPCEHLIQIYEEDDVFIDSLEAFVSAGILANEATVVITTSSHLKGLETRLLLKGIRLDDAEQADLYIPIDANKALAGFMTYGSPDESLFRKFILGLVDRAKGRRIRAFGEMIALLSGQGFKSATNKLEEFWNTLSNNESFNLFCVYPKLELVMNARVSLDNIRQTHEAVIAGRELSETAAVQPSIEVL
jgi:hypothetical protein